MDTMRRSQNVTGGSGWNIALGIWTIVSAFVLVHDQNNAFAWNNVIVGIVIAIIALGRTDVHGSNRSGWNVALGIWMIISPFVLRFSHLPALVWNNIIVGILVALAAWVSLAHRVTPPIRRMG